MEGDLLEDNPKDFTKEVNISDIHLNGYNYDLTLLIMLQIAARTEKEHKTTQLLDLSGIEDCCGQIRSQYINGIWNNDPMIN